MRYRTERRGNTALMEPRFARVPDRSEGTLKGTENTCNKANRQTHMQLKHTCTLHPTHRQRAANLLRLLTSLTLPLSLSPSLFRYFSPSLFRYLSPSLAFFPCVRFHTRGITKDSARTLLPASRC